MAGTWVRTGTIALTSGSKKVTGTGTAWNSGLNKVTKGCALKHNGIDYEVDYVNSDTELYLVDTYNGATLSGQAYRIQVAVTDTIPELSSRIAQALAYWNGQGANLQLMMSGSGNVTLTFPDGTQVTIPAWGNMQPKDGLLTAIAALTTSADKLFYATGADAVAMTTLSAKGRELIDDADSSAMLTTLGVSTFIKSLLDDTDAAAALGTLGITKASLAETNSRLATDRVVTPAGLNAVVPYAPTVNPTLDLDFAKQKYRWYAGAAGLTESSTPSLMTFTRSSVATYFDAMGVMQQASANTPRIDYDPLTGECKGLLVEEQRTNFLSASDHSWWAYNGSGYIIQRAAVAPDGTLSATRVIGTSLAYGNGAFRHCTISTTGTVTLSVYIKAVATGIIRLSAEGGSINNGSSCEAYFDPLSGYSASVVTANTTASSVNVGGGWYRLWLTAPATSTTDINLVVYGWDNTMFTDFYVWGAQLEAGAFPTSYIPTPATFTGRASTATYLDSNGVLQTAASGVARSAAYGYDSDGVLRPIGLLLESAATNLISYSNPAPAAMFSDPSTTATAVSDSRAILGGMLYSISGDAYVVVGSATGNATLQAGTYCFSLYSTSDSPIEMYVHGDAYKTSAVTKATSGMFRHYTVFTLTTESVTNLHIRKANAHLVSGFMLEQGSYPTSYIQTSGAQATRVADTSTSAQVTRALDVALISGVNFSQWYKQYEGSLFCEINNDISAANDSAGVARGVAILHDNTDNNTFRLGAAAGTASVVTKSGGSQSYQSAGSATVGRHKHMISYIKDQVNVVTDSTIAITDSSAAMPFVSMMRLGATLVNGGGNLNSHIRTLKYYPKALASAELQAMTA